VGIAIVDIKDRDRWTELGRLGAPDLQQGCGKFVSRRETGQPEHNLRACTACGGSK
jgi:hypothetical protein